MAEDAPADPRGNPIGTELVFEDDPLITNEFKQQRRQPNIFVWAMPDKKADGSQEVSYTIRLRSGGDQ